MITFLNALFTDGALTLAAQQPEMAPQNTEALLVSAEKIWRTQMPLDPPGFDIVSALMAARILETACRAVVHREIGIERTEQFIRECGLRSSDDPDQHYSVDLVLRFLPQVSERAARISDADPLLEILKTIGQEWPLSSVGMPGCAIESLPVGLQHPSLWRLYVDRVISRKDKSRLNIASVSDAVAAAIGPFSWLAPELAGILQK
ncbi:MAG: hypothetical protein O2856_05210 [Planctomycetota bacterium]|nr:hypothetical protein [Planctomycetota bacterium]